ncbi:MAG: L-seryl-tRNA(Sec) selenium transferase [Sarcina sp.]
MKKDLLRGLPKVDPLLETERIKNLIKEFTREQVKIAIREAIDFYRINILNDKIITPIKEDDVILKVLKILDNKFDSSLKRVINGTGIVIHTNLGRSVLSDNAVSAIANVASNYSNLEYDLDKGKRGSRYSHIEGILKQLVGSEGAVVVNNNAAAVMLVLNEITKSKEAIISRGELVEIGGSFRIPDVMEYSGAILREVGATNRTHLEDYEKAINENTGVLLKVHSSNFKIIGFTKEVSSKELATLGNKYNVPTYEDLGSGTLINFDGIFKEEKTVKDSVEAGIDIVSFSGDKMLGGPQAGIIVGKKEYIDKIKKNPLIRALRVDKFTLAGLEATLMEYLKRDKVVEIVPTLRMISESKENIRIRAEHLASELKKTHFNIEIKEDYSFVGGGAMPQESIKTFVIEISNDNISAIDVEKSLRKNDIPIIGRIKNEKYLLDLRTIREEEYRIILEALDKVEVK